MNVQPENSNGNDLTNDLTKELAARLADMEAANHALQEEIERKNKALEGFIAENEALKAELGGKGAPKSNGNERVPVEKNGAAGEESVEDLIARVQRLGW